MDTLLGKLIDLAYEFFGVILPGFFFLILLTIWSVAAGPTLEAISLDHIPAVTFSEMDRWEAALSRTRRIELLVLGVVLCYFLGQLLNWFSRGRESPGAPKESDLAAGTSGSANPGSASKKERVKATVERSGRFVLFFLLFQFPKPPFAFNKKLRPLFVATGKALSTDQEEMEWRAFYPVAKRVITRRISNSLLPTYQHKYTLHRCVAAMSAVLFWLCVLACLLAVLVGKAGYPDWFFVGVLGITSLFLGCAFLKSYSYFWVLWGDTIVAESYELTCAPKRASDDKNK